MPSSPPSSAARRQRSIVRGGRSSSSSSSSSSSVALAAVVVAFLTSPSSSSAALAPPMTSPRGGRTRTTTTTPSTMTRCPPDRWRRDRHDHRTTTTTTTTTSYSTPWSSPSSSSSSSTALRFFFDRFLNPYGISSGGGGDRTRDGEDDDDEDGELLDALLPRLPTRIDRSRMLEGFQRARLYEQLRLSKIKRSARERGGDCGGVVGGDEGNDVNDDDNPLDEDSRGPSGRDVDDDDDDDDDDSSRMMGSFHRARHAEQLRLRENNGEGSWGGGGGGGGTTTSQRRVDGEGGIRRGDDDDFFDKDEAFQRALLEERLRIRRLQRQRCDYVETATMECERENSDVNKAPQLMTMVQENEIDEDVDDVYGSEKDSERYLAGTGIASSANDDGSGNSNMLFARKLLVNRTEEDGPTMQLDAKLEKLRQMVTAATTPSSRAALSSAIASNNASSSMQTFLSKTHLPLPPREDASSLSLALAPVAHLLTSVFLLGAAGCYAAMAVVDVICNDDEAECSTRACLRGTSSVFRSCWDYIFPKGGGRNDGVDLRSAAWRTMRALRTSICASFYAVRCVLLRSSGHSKYAHESMDAVTGSLRYLVYAIRSVNVVLTRVMDIVRRSYEYIVRWSSICIHSLQTFYYCSDHDEKLTAVGSSRSLRHRLNPLRVISDIKIATLHRLREHSSLKNEEQRLRSDELYNKKLRLLNLDRVALERDRQHLQEAWRQLEFEKRKMIAEGVNVLAWYVAAGKLAAKASHEVVEKRKDQNSQNWNFWRRREDNTPSDK